jgi:hypothetical protein
MCGQHADAAAILIREKSVPVGQVTQAPRLCFELESVTLPDVCRFEEGPEEPFGVHARAYAASRASGTSARRPVALAVAVPVRDGLAVAVR